MENERILHALWLMYSQYCTGPSGHQNMQAGEEAEKILKQYRLIREDGSVNLEFEPAYWMP